MEINHIRTYWDVDRENAEWDALAEHFAADAHTATAQRAASQDASDTDGYVSQWAHGVTSRYDSMAAELATARGLSVFPALFDLDGHVVSTHRAEGEWGTYWVLSDPSPTGKVFVNESKAGKDDTFRRNMAKKGFAVGTIKCRAYPDYVGGGTGLSGATNVTVAIKPLISRLRAGEYTVVSSTHAPWMGVER